MLSSRMDVRNVPSPLWASLLSQMEGLAELIYLQGFLWLSHSVSQTLVIRGHQFWPFPSWVTSEAEIVLGLSRKYESSHCCNILRPILRSWGPTGLVWGWGRCQRQLPDYTSLSEFLLLKGTARLGPRDLLGRPSTEERALSFRSQDFPESVFPAPVNSHSQVAYLHCSTAAHRTCHKNAGFSGGFPLLPHPQHSWESTSLLE